MTTSNTATFTVGRDDIIKASMRSLKVIGVGETPVPEDYTNCAFALNLLLKSLDAEGYLIWLYQTLAVPLSAGKTSYTIAESGADVLNYRPVRVAAGWLSDSSSPVNDVPMILLSRQQFDQLTPKVLSGTPNSIYYDPQLTAGVLYPWPQPTGTTYTAKLLIQRPVQDIDSAATSSQNFDLSQEWFLPLRWILADEVSSEYEVDLNTQKMVSSRATFWRNKMADFSREEASVQFQPDPQSMNRGLR